MSEDENENKDQDVIGLKDIKEDAKENKDWELWFEMILKKIKHLTNKWYIERKCVSR